LITSSFAVAAFQASTARSICASICWIWPSTRCASACLEATLGSAVAPPAASRPARSAMTNAGACRFS